MSVADYSQRNHAECIANEWTADPRARPRRAFNPVPQSASAETPVRFVTKMPAAACTLFVLVTVLLIHPTDNPGDRFSAVALEILILSCIPVLRAV